MGEGQKNNATMMEMIMVMGPAIALGIFAGAIYGDMMFGALFGTVLGIVSKVLADNLDRAEFITLYGMIGGLGLGVILFSDVKGGILVSTLVGLLGGFLLGMIVSRKKDTA